jgi:zinc transport system permease protein
MNEFLQAVVSESFMRNALLAGVLASVACGIVGTYVVTRRITFIAGAIAHSVLGGLGAARYCSVVFGWQWFHPMLGATIAALLSAAVIGWISLRSSEREDTVIGAIWAIGMAVGILFIYSTPGYQQDLMSYLFGNILLVSHGELLMMAVLDAIIVAVTLLFFNSLESVCFDEEFARLRGLRVEAYYMALLALTALTVVLLVSIVGLVMVIALITLPAAIAGRLRNTLGSIMTLAALISMLLTSAGLAISYAPNLPSGATIILLAGALYLVVALFTSPLLKRRGNTR